MMQTRNTVENQRVIPERVIAALERVLEYTFYEELVDCRKTCWNNEARQEAHIFSELLTIRNWLNEGTMSPELPVQWWLKHG